MSLKIENYCSSISKYVILFWSLHAFLSSCPAYKMKCWWDCIIHTTFLHLSFAKAMKWNALLYHWFVACVICFIQVTVQLFLHHHVISQFLFPKADHALWTSQTCSFGFDFFTSLKSIPQWLIFWNVRVSGLYNWNGEEGRWRVFCLDWNECQMLYCNFIDSQKHIKYMAMLFVTVPTLYI